jgi:predicted helicase
MSALRELLATYTTTAKTPRELGTYFEELTVCFLKYEPAYASLYQNVWTYSEWAGLRGMDKRDTGHRSRGRDDHRRGPRDPVQALPEDYVLRRPTSTASSPPRARSRSRIASSSARRAMWSEHAEDALQDQQPPVSKIDLAALEASLIDWSRFEPRQAARPQISKKELRPTRRARSAR